MDDRHLASKYAPLLRAGTWFQFLPADLQERLLSMMSIRRLDSGQCLFARGDAPDGMYCVVEGAIRITAISEGGKEALLTIVEQPHWFGEIALFDGKPRTHDAWSEGSTVLVHLQQESLRKMLDAHPAYWPEFGLLLTQKIRTLFLAVEEIALLPAPSRLARRLVLIAEGYGEWKDRSRRSIQIPQEQLALMLSLSRQTVNQILKELASQGAIRLARGGIEITDIDMLRRLAV
jgi:CRP/FNR family transcriptional regulator, cyclic AMP receptor protein